MRIDPIHRGISGGESNSIMARTNKLDLSDFLPYLTNRLGTALVERFTTEALRANNLTISLWRVLAALSHLGPQRQVDIADLTSIEVSTISRLVTRLVQLGLATRVRSNTSSREVTVALTAKAKKLVNKLAPIALRLEQNATTGISPATLAATKATLRRMYINLTELEDSEAGPRRMRSTG